MNAFVQLLTDFYLSINNTLGLGFLNDITESWTGLMLGQNNFVPSILVILFIFNLINRPSKYKIKFLGLPKIFQIIIRQPLYLLLMTNGAFFMVALVPMTLLLLFAPVLLSKVFSSGTDTGPFGMIFKR